MALVGNFSVGRDVTAIVIAPNGTRLDLTGLTEVRWVIRQKKVRSEPLNAPPIERYLPDGHELTFELDRANSNNEQFCSQVEQGWWTLGSADPGTWAGGTVYIYVTETDGSQTVKEFTGASLALVQGGDARVENPIKQRIEGFAQRMKTL